MGWLSRKSDRWERKPGDIAIRIESSDVKSQWGNKPFVVFDGTVALVFSQGRKLGQLASGKHDIDGRFRSWLAGDDPTTLIIVDDGDISLDVSVPGLHSQENISLDMRLRLTLCLDPPETFYLNVMKGRKRYGEDDLRSHLRPELFDALLAFTSTHLIEDLYHNPVLRQQAADQLRQRVGESLGRLGFRLVALNVVRVSSDQFDAHRAGQAGVILESKDADVEAARLEVLRRVRDDLAESIKHKAITKSELLDAIQQATHELGLKDRLREDELDRLSAKLEQDAEDYEQQRTQARELTGVEHELEVDATKRTHDREQSGLDLDTFLNQRIKTAATDEELRDLERSGDEKDWDLASKMRADALSARKRMKQDDVEILAEKGATVSKMDTETKIALGLGDQEALLELVRMGQERQLSPDQLLIKAAEGSEAVAAALAERFKSEGKLNDEVIDQLRRQIDQERLTNREHAAQLERVLKQSLEQMGKVATAKAESQGPGDQTIVTHGMGGATVINPNKPDNDKDDD